MLIKLGLSLKDRPYLQVSEPFSNIKQLEFSVVADISKKKIINFFLSFFCFSSVYSKIKCYCNVDLRIEVREKKKLKMYINCLLIHHRHDEMKFNSNTIRDCFSFLFCIHIKYVIILVLVFFYITIMGLVLLLLFFVLTKKK